MHNVIVGTAGHVDHGKTCLIKALTGSDTDRLKEEKKRGITIELGFTYMPNPYDLNIGIIDVPGHERFVRNMLAGIGGIDLVLLVVAADEGVMPQTIEHFEILKLLHIKKGIIVITKVDLVEPDWLEMVKEDIENTVKDSFLQKAPVMAVSSYTGENINELKQLICEMVKTVEVRENLPTLLRIPVDRVFTIDGFGTVITGTLMEGSIKVGDEVQVYPGEKIVKVRSLQVHGNMVDTALAGQRTAVNVLNVKKEEIKRGDVIAAKASMKNTHLLDVKINMFEGTKRSLINGSRLHLYYGSAEVLCKAVLLDKEALNSGEEGYAQLRLEEKAAVKRGDRFILRFYSPVETIGGGIILDASPEKHRRYKEDVLQSLRVKEKGKDSDILDQFLKEVSKDFLTHNALARKLGKSINDILKEIEVLTERGSAIKISDNISIHSNYVLTIEKKVFNILNEFHQNNPISPGMQKGEFRKRLSDSLRIKDAKILDLLIKYLINNEKIAEKVNIIALPDFRIVYSEQLLLLKDQLENKYMEFGFMIPELDGVLKDYKDKNLTGQLVDALATEGRLKRISYQHFMHIEHWNNAMKILDAHMKQNGGITLAEYRDLLGASRKYASIILEYLDNQKITKLIDDVRVYI